MISWLKKFSPPQEIPEVLAGVEMLSKIPGQNGSSSPAGLENRLETHRPLGRIARLLYAARYGGLFAGAIFLIWELSETFLLEDRVAFTMAMEIALVLFAFFVLVWVGSKWGEKHTRELRQGYAELLAANQSAREELTKRQQVEDASAGFG